MIPWSKIRKCTFPCAITSIGASGYPHSYLEWTDSPQKFHIQNASDTAVNFFSCSITGEHFLCGSQAPKLKICGQKLKDWLVSVNGVGHDFNNAVPYCDDAAHQFPVGLAPKRYPPISTKNIPHSGACAMYVLLATSFLTADVLSFPQFATATARSGQAPLKQASGQASCLA